MDSSPSEVAADGLWPPSRGNHPATPPSQMACTCHCSGGERSVSSVVTNETSGHYFSPVSSFSHHSMDDGKEPMDSLEYKNVSPPVRESPPVRKASLDRILSPQVTRRPVYFSSVHQSRDKSISPIGPPATAGTGHNPLSTSMSNASIHSNYSEDSLTAANGAAGGRTLSSSPFSVGGATAAPAGQRWNNVHYETSGQWIADSGSCMEQRPSVVTATAAATTTTADPLDFSKDSLNHSSTQAVEDDEEEESESCSSSVKLEPLAFTIDFGDVTPVHKKKETPKRLAERLCTPRTTTKAEAVKKSESGGVTEASGESKNTKMLKSLSNRLGSGHHQQLNPLAKFGSAVEVETVATSVQQHSSRRTATTPIKGPTGGKGVSNSTGSRQSSTSRATNISDQQQLANRTTNGQQQQQRKPKAGLKHRTPSPTPPSSPVKSSDRPPVYGMGRGERLLLQQQQQQQHSIESDTEGGANYEDEEVAGLLLDLAGNPAGASAAMANDEEEEEEEEEEDGQQRGGDNDTASETGTYTIGKDSPSPDEDQSRRDIDRVFGLVPSSSPPRFANAEGGSVHTGTDSTPQWVRDWAAQVAQQQQEASSLLPPPGSVGLTKPPSHPQHRPPPPELPTSARPRRRLPSVPPGALINGNSRSRSSPRTSQAEMSDPSDSSLETESFLRDTESVVSAMQARVDGRSSTESDVETRSSSTSYRPTSAQQHPADLENSIGRKLSAQLRAKIRSLDESYQTTVAATTLSSTTSGSTSITTTSSATSRKTSYVISSGGNASSGTIAQNNGAANNVIIHNELHGSGGDDAKSLHSDSSLSDVTSGETSSRSRHHHEDNKAANQNAPAVRYNRALSLRRGRLGLDADQAVPPAATKDRSSRANHSPSRGSSPQVPPPSSSQQVPASRKLSSASGQSQASSRAGSASAAFSRNDGGRFSLRVGGKTSSSSSSSAPPSSVKSKVSSKSGGNVQQQHPPLPPPHMASGPRKSRSNSTLSSKEAEFQNWKRRKNYDPMKAAAEGKKKEAARRSVTHTALTMSQSMIGPVASNILNSSPSSQSPSPPPRTIIRSASFTCVNNVKGRSSVEPEMKYNNSNGSGVGGGGSGSSRRTSSSLHKPSSMFYSSEDETELLYNSPSKKASTKPSSGSSVSVSTRAQYLGLNLLSSGSPSSASAATAHLHHHQYHHHNSPPSLPADFSDLASIASNDVDLTSSPGSPRRKLYMEDGLLMRTSASNSSLRARTKLEALDNLVISTIHGLSTKIRSNAESLLRKLRPQYLEDIERLGLIDDTLNRLADCVTESPIHAVTGGRSSSRELSGTLKVMKRVEQVFQALDQVLFEEVLDGGGEEGAILNDGGTTTEGEDWNGGYTSGDFY